MLVRSLDLDIAVTLGYHVLFRLLSILMLSSSLLNVLSSAKR